MLATRTGLVPRTAGYNIIGVQRPSTSACRRLEPRHLNQRTKAADVATEVAAEAPQQAITLSDKAVAHISKLKAEMAKDNLLLRVGVKQGGCSGMSYVMDFEEEGNIKGDDYVIQYDGFKMACDPKSLLYLFGMHLDYSDALIGGGFSFSNPNATNNCGCGKSFSV